MISSDQSIIKLLNGLTTTKEPLKIMGTLDGYFCCDFELLTYEHLKSVFNVWSGRFELLKFHK